MRRRYEPVDLRLTRRVPASGQPHKVDIEQFARGPVPVSGFIEALPRLLAAEDLRRLVADILAARRADRPVLLMMGAHVVKCGLGPVVIALMERDLVTAVAMNGAASVHDCEIALLGHTSEDVAPAMERGVFGMTAETGEFLNRCISRAAKEGLGLGEALGADLRSAPHAEKSVLAAAHALGCQATVHVAIGTDIHHMHADADGAALGAASHTDFRLLAGAVRELTGGVVMNVGSAVLLPQVFEKALAVARNTGSDVRNFTAANLDFVQLYRPGKSILEKARDLGGRGYALTGHHEIMLPLVAWAVIEGWRESEGQVQGTR
jgi:hypothetical protein